MRMRENERERERMRMRENERERARQGGRRAAAEIQARLATVIQIDADP